MSLNAAQSAALKADILADATLNAFPNNSDGAFEIAKAYNLPASPAFVVWRSTLTPDLSRTAIVAGAVQLDNLTAGKRDALLYLAQGSLDCRKTEVRPAIDDLCGSQNTLKASLLAAEKRNATRAEKLFATGTGSDAAPATTTFEGTLTYQDVEAARNS